MGIPSFYRWLVERYPLTVKEAIEEAPNFVNGVRVPPDSSGPNPNGLEFDNLYLDMNGIIHPCFHPEGLPAPKTYDEVFKAVFKYIDKIFSIVRPRKLLYMAIDGVAPRAKMNQQRSRRFRSAKEAADEGSGTEKQSGISKLEGKKKDTMKLDSNIITPGTEFMALLSSTLKYYVHMRMNGDPGWQGVKVIVSDASVPGEGEHKIMSYIRLQRNLPGFDPNTRHCLYGLDADLIMLALATHEIHFSILREEVVHKKHMDTFKKMKGQACGEYLDDFILRQKFQFLNIWVLRSYLAYELRIPDSKVETDLERLIDDFVFMCLFVGNDFLPHVPSLEISEGAIDLLMIIYKKEFVKMGGYLTNSSEVNLKRVEHFVQAVGSHEDAIFKKRQQVNKQREAQFRRSSTNAQRKKTIGSVQGHSTQSSVNGSKDSTVLMPDAGNSEIDKVKLGVEGWKERYYTEKFEVKTDDERERTQRDTVLKYTEGICWVMHYYYQGVCSWQWFYPYHYAPFASDLCGIDQLEIKFTLGEPFKPLDQLMAVLPAASAQALPLLYSKLMTDPSSPILDYYPSDFELDLNGKHLAWQAVCKLPFIMESRLLSEIAKVEPMLTDEEKKRNSLGLDMLFVHFSNPLAVKILSFCERNRDHPKLPYAKVKKKIDPIFSGGMNGYVCISDKPVNPVEISSPIDDMETITDNKVISVLYKYPSYHPHIPKPPEGVQMPAESVNEHDLPPPPVMWHIPTLFGRELNQRPIPKLAIFGSQLANSACQLVFEYYFGRWKSMSEAIENCVDGERKTDGGSENYVDSERKTVGGSENRADGERKTNGGSENLIDGGANMRKTKRRRKCGNKVLPEGGQVPPNPLPGGNENHIDGGAKKSKKRTKKRRKLGNEEVPLEGQLAPKPVAAGSENHIVGGAKNKKRTKRQKSGDEVVSQEVQNSPKPLAVGNENNIDGGATKRKRKWMKLLKYGNKEVPREGQLAPKPVGAGSENGIDGGAKEREPIQKFALKLELLPGPTNTDQVPLHPLPGPGPTIPDEGPMDLNATNPDQASMHPLPGPGPTIPNERPMDLNPTNIDHIDQAPMHPMPAPGPTIPDEGPMGLVQIGIMEDNPTNNLKSLYK